MNCDHIWFSGHAVKRMFDRSIRHDEVTEVVRLGEVIADYPDDEPFPSCLMSGFVHGRPLHVVVAMKLDPNHVILLQLMILTPIFGKKTLGRGEPNDKPAMSIM